MPAVFTHLEDTDVGGVEESARRPGNGGGGLLFTMPSRTVMSSVARSRLRRCLATGGMARPRSHAVRRGSWVRRDRKKCSPSPGTQLSIHERIPRTDGWSTKWSTQSGQHAGAGELRGGAVRGRARSYWPARALVPVPVRNRSRHRSLGRVCRQG